MEYILSSLDMFAGISDNLINYTFNVSIYLLSRNSLADVSIGLQMSSYQMNEVMRRLTLATIIFLPLTLLTGYFVSPLLANASAPAHTLRPPGYEFRVHVVGAGQLGRPVSHHITSYLGIHLRIIECVQILDHRAPGHGHRPAHILVVRYGEDVALHSEAHHRTHCQAGASILLVLVLPSTDYVRQKYKQA